jgi:hypothetical protein
MSAAAHALAVVGGDGPGGVRSFEKRPSLGGSWHRLLNAPMVRFSAERLSAENGSDPARQAGHLVQRERQPMISQLIRIPAVELAACGNGAHLVVDLGPADVSAAVAETDELNNVGRWRLTLRSRLSGSRGGHGRPIGHGLIASEMMRRWAGLGTRVAE